MISVRRRALGHPWAFAGDADTRDIAWKGVGLMIRIENHLGTIEISQEYFSYLIGSAASSCYGVAGMVRSGTRQGLRSIFSKRAYADEGIRVRSENDKLIVDLHISVIYGMNISAIAKSIVNKVHYTVEEVTGLQVKKVNVFVDGMKSE